MNTASTYQQNVLNNNTVFDTSEFDRVKYGITISVNKHRICHLDDATYNGNVYWITGLSCSGKTTLGRLLCDRLRRSGRACVQLDGDQLREAFDNDLGHGIIDRRRSARRYSGLSRMFAEQGIDVVCSTISLFHDVQRWNRANIQNYYEILMRAPLQVLIARDGKGLYRGALSGEIDDVVGIDLPAQEPEHPDIVIDNDGSQSPAALIDMLTVALGLDDGGAP